MRLKELAESRVRYGHRRLHILLQREGWHVNHKRLYRLYCEEGLSIRTRGPKRRRACRYRSGRSEADDMKDVWAMDFMSDRLFDGKPFRILTIVNCFTRGTSRPLQGRTSAPIRASTNWTDWPGSEASLEVFVSTTARSLPVGCATNGTT